VSDRSGGLIQVFYSLTAVRYTAGMQICFNQFRVYLITTLVFLVVPVTTYAYSVIDENVYVVNDSLIMFTQTFSFGVLNSDAYLSYQAEKGETDSFSRTVNYLLVEDGQPLPAIVSSIGVLLSDAPVINGLYRVTERQPEEFTLLAFVTLPEPDPSLINRNLSMELVRLPFTTFTADSVQQFFFPLPASNSGRETTSKSEDVAARSTITLLGSEN